MHLIDREESLSEIVSIIIVIIYALLSRHEVVVTSDSASSVLQLELVVTLKTGCYNQRVTYFIF